MFRTFQRIRHINRYREIVNTFAKHGFGEFISRLGLYERLSLLRRRENVTTTHLDAPTRLRIALEELGPTFIKLGQMLSTRPDVLPVEFILELEKLQDEVPQVPWEIVKATIEKELGAPLETHFEYVDPSAIAAASLAQVHRGRLQSGEAVALKVQRPNIEHTIEIDLEILHDVAAIMQTVTPLGKVYDLPDIVEDFAYTLDLELDYRYEAHHADIFRQNFTNETLVRIPYIHWEYVTAKLLVMEYLDGIKIDDLAALDAAGHDRQTLAYNAARLVVKEVLEDGFFHADPHPGNLLVMQDGVIGALDFGIVGWLDNQLRVQLAQLYIVTVRRDVEGMIERMIKVGIADADVDRKDLRHDLSRLLRKYYGRSFSDVSATDFMRDITPVVFRNKLHIPTDLWLLLKTLVVMEGIGQRLDPTFNVFEVSQPFIRRLERQLRSPRRLAELAVDTGISLGQTAIEVPELSVGLLRRLDQGKLKVLIEPTEYERLLARIDRVTNRLVVGILLSALILGLALLIPNATEQPAWFAALLIAGFIAASGLGLWMTISIIRGGS
ncbi:MAG: ABC1 kinase family protein [Anaerolineales bacterium]